MREEMSREPRRTRTNPTGVGARRPADVDDSEMCPLILSKRRLAGEFPAIRSYIERRLGGKMGHTSVFLVLDGAQERHPFALCSLFATILPDAYACEHWGQCV